MASLLSHLAMFSRLVVLLAIAALCTDGRPSRQFLPPVPGYIPVYIRQGDTPLEDINPDLAEAFESYARKQTKLALGKSQIPVVVQWNEVEDVSEGHVQKIPRT